MPGVTEPTTSGPPTSRRTLAKAAVAATVGVGAVGAAVRLGQDDDTEERGGALVLSAEGGSDIAELEVPLELGRARNGVRETESLPTSLYSMVGVTWRGDASPEVWARARRSDGWTDWTRLPVLEDRPEDDAWQADRRGTAAWWVGPSRAVQVRVAGAAPKGMRLVLLHPAGRTSDQAVGTAARLAEQVAALAEAARRAPSRPPHGGAGLPAAPGTGRARGSRGGPMSMPRITGPA